MTGAEIVERCGHLIRQLAGKAAQRFGGELDDWHQDLALNILTHAHKYDPKRGAPTTWVYVRYRQVIGLHTQAVRCAKRSGRCVPLGSDDDTCPVSVADIRVGDPADEVERRDLCEAVRRRLRGMTPRRFFAVACRFGFIGADDTRAIGAAMGIGPSAVHQLIHAGLSSVADDLRTLVTS